MTRKDDAEVKGKLTRSLKNDIKNLVNFHASSRKSEILHFDGLLLSKVCKVIDEKVQKSPWHERVTRNLKNNWLLVPKMTGRIRSILMLTVASLEICTLMCYFCRKYIIFESKKYRGVMCDNTEEWYKIWRRTGLCFVKWHEKSGEFWLNTPKSQNLHFDWLLLTKVYNVWDKNLQRSYLSWH